MITEKNWRPVLLLIDDKGDTANAAFGRKNQDVDPLAPRLGKSLRQYLTSTNPLSDFLANGGMAAYEVGGNDAIYGSLQPDQHGLEIDEKSNTNEER